MYRTELSWEKVKRKCFQDSKVSKNNEEAQKANDYLLADKKNEKHRKKRTLKSVQFLKMRDKKGKDSRMDNFHQEYITLKPKTEILIPRSPSRLSKNLFCKKIQSMKSISTTDTKKETINSFGSSFYASNYQI